MGMTVCSLASGSSGNATLVGAGGARVLVDAGVSCKRICQELEGLGVHPAELSGILVTHEHVDHIRGIRVLSRRFGLPVYANAGTWAAMADQLQLPAASVRVFDTAHDFYIDDIAVESFAIPHDAAEPVGYCLHSGTHKVALATDIGHMTDDIAERLLGSSLVLLESNHDVQMVLDGPYPERLKRRILGRKGHLSNLEAGQTLLRLAKSGVRHALLGHLSQHNNIPELAYQTVAASLMAGGAVLGQDLTVDMTWRDRAGALYTLR